MRRRGGKAKPAKTCSWHELVLHDLFIFFMDCSLYWLKNRVWLSEDISSGKNLLHENWCFRVNAGTLIVVSNSQSHSEKISIRYYEIFSLERCQMIFFFLLEMQSLQPFHDSKSYSWGNMNQHIERIRTRFEAYQNLSPSSFSWFLTAKHSSVCQRPHSSEHSKQWWWWCLIILADAASSHCLISVCFPPTHTINSMVKLELLMTWPPLQLQKNWVGQLLPSFQLILINMQTYTRESSMQSFFLSTAHAYLQLTSKPFVTG